MVEKILNNTTPYGKIRASHEGSLHSSTLMIYETSYKSDKNGSTFPIYFLMWSLMFYLKI